MGLKEELNEMIDVFDYYQIPEERQRTIIGSGVYFEFSHNDSRRLNCLDFAQLLKLARTIDSEFDANQMLEDLNNRRDSKYEELVKLYVNMKHTKKDKQKNKSIK